MTQRKLGSQSTLIHRKLSEILLKKSKDPRFTKVTVSRVEADAELSYAKVYIATYPPENIESLIESLNRAAGFFSSSLGRTLQTRRTPKLVFVYDSGFDYSFKMDAMIRDANRPTEE